MVWKGTSFSLKNLFICVRNIYCENLWVSLSALKINDFKITPIYGIPEKKLKMRPCHKIFWLTKIKGGLWIGT